MLDKLRKQTFKHQGKYLSIKIWLPILEKTYFYTEKIQMEQKKTWVVMKSRSCEVPMNFPWPNVKISVQDIFALLKPATKKNIFIERENKQANKR